MGSAQPATSAFTSSPGKGIAVKQGRATSGDRELAGKQAARTHHRNGGVELGNAHSAGRVLAVEAFIRETATVVGLHCRLRSVGIQVNEFLTWTNRQGDMNRKNRARSCSSEKQMVRKKRGQSNQGASS